MGLTRGNGGVVSLDRADVEARRGERLGELGASNRTQRRRQDAVERDSEVLLCDIRNQDARFAEELDQVASSEWGLRDRFDQIGAAYTCTRLVACKQQCERQLPVGRTN